MPNLHIQHATFSLLQHHKLSIDAFRVDSHDFWVVVGGNGSGKSAFALALQGAIPLYEGEYRNGFHRIALLSFERQQKIIEQILHDRNNDTVSPDDYGLTARDIILNGGENTTLCVEYAARLGIEHLLPRPFIQLSTGESRKVLLCQALVAEPDLLILDEPFEGLDQASVRYWTALLTQLQRKMAFVL